MFYYIEVHLLDHYTQVHVLFWLSRMRQDWAVRRSDPRGCEIFRAGPKPSVVPFSLLYGGTG
jgi:hypothetical protein